MSKPCFTPHLSKEDLLAMPLCRFDGTVYIIDDSSMVAEAAAWLNSQKVVGVDTEARPNFTPDTHYPTSLVQIAAKDRCYLFRLNFIGMPAELISIFTNPELVKVGLAFRDDIKGLQKFRRFTPANCIELQTMAPQYGIMELGLQKMFAICYGKRISKSQQLTNWENKQLTAEQAQYAATDAWATLMICNRLMQAEPLSMAEQEKIYREEKMMKAAAAGKQQSGDGKDKRDKHEQLPKAVIVLKAGKEESVKRFHPWVFSGAIAKIIPLSQTRQIKEGDLVKVTDKNGEILGVGHYQIGSIAVRILAFNNDRLPAAYWHDRIAAAYNMRKELNLQRQDNNTYRLIHGEGDFLPGLVIDIYADTAIIQAHSIGMHNSRKAIAYNLRKVMPEIKNIYYKSDDTLPYKAQIDGENRGWLFRENNITEEDAGTRYYALENGLTFNIDWLQGQKTGFFIDQRENRSLLEQLSCGKTVLNMFCYTGGFSVYALRGGAKTVHSVDASERAVNLTELNVLNNFPDAANHRAFACDAFDFLEANKPDSTLYPELRTGEQYDLIVLDPPAFAKHRDAIKNALKGYQRLNAKAMQIIKSGGILFTFSCSQAIDKDMFRRAVFSAAAQTGRKVRILYQLHQPADHPVNIYHPEGEYLKGLVLYIE